VAAGALVAKLGKIDQILRIQNWGFGAALKSDRIRIIEPSQISFWALFS
jgi:hypothetical protein